MRHILSIDGGGIRGVLPTCALIQLEQQTQKLTRQVFDFVAGTSTGALITASVAAGIPATRILEIYTQRSKEIFNHSPEIALGLRLERGWAYDPHNLERLLVSEFGAAASWKLNDCPVKILLTAKGVDKKPWYFVNDNPHNARTTGRLGLIDCAVASACATTYFDAWNIPGIGELYDGGLGVTGNPVHQACVEAVHYDTYSPAGTRVISLGTGYTAPAATKPAGIIAELSWLLDDLLSAPEDEQTDLVRRYYPGMMRRLDWAMPAAVDMADVAAIPSLVQLGQQAAAALDWSALL